MLIDALEPIELGDEVSSHFGNHIRYLHSRSTGLKFLYLKVKTAEDKFRKGLRPDVRVFAAGNIPGLNTAERNLLECFFDWYAVSIRNYARMCGWMKYQEKCSQRELKAYLEKVVPGPMTYRDKIGAHPAAAEFKDNLAEKDASVIPQVTWDDSRFWVGSLNVFRKRGNETEGRDSTKIKPWSLTTVHEELSLRYPLLKLDDRPGRPPT